MSTSISLTYPEIHPGVEISFTPGWTTAASEIYRTLAATTRSRAFQVAAEAVAVLSIFTAIALWAFTLTPGLTSFSGL